MRKFVVLLMAIAMVVTFVPSVWAGFTMGEKGDYSLSISGYVKSNLEFAEVEEIVGSGVDESVVNKDVINFYNKEIRVKFSGDVLEDWAYVIQVDAAGDATVIKDAAITWKNVGDSPINLKMGQFKAPFSRQFLTSGTKGQFIERPDAKTGYVPGRDQGLQADAFFGEDKMIYAALGFFNGEGERTDNGDDNLLIAGRISFDPFGYMPLSEGDLEMTEELVASFGLQFSVDQNETEDCTVIGIDAAMKLSGLYAAAEIYIGTESEDGEDDVDSMGFFLQAGYMFNESVEAVARISSSDPDTDTDDDAFTEVTIGANYYFKKHNCKVSLNYEINDNETNDPDDNRLLAQVQVAF
jgi:phosphate-selective porin OprO and OprP